eukprot:gb/GECH01007132.1/.p1 GENE.gb/GECH01007132.1/~~gb/GECH01007132.1/.p1  ORF type:complete len:1106 (+),score=354.86 gb/GECH01007132.1/:1-3318(+)
MFKKLRQDHQKFKFSFTIHKLQDLDGQRDIPPLSVEWARGKKRNGSTAIATAPPSSRHGVEILWNETFETKGTMFFSKQKKSSKENNSSPKFLKKSLEFKILEHPNESSTNNKKKNKPKIIGTSEVDLAGFCDIKESMEKVVSIPIAKLRDHPSATLLVTIKSWLRSEDDEGSTISAMTSEGELSEIDNDETEFSQEKDSINNNNNDDNESSSSKKLDIPKRSSGDVRNKAKFLETSGVGMYGSVSSVESARKRSSSHEHHSEDSSSSPSSSSSTPKKRSKSPKPAVSKEEKKMNRRTLKNFAKSLRITGGNEDSGEVSDSDVSSSNSTGSGAPSPSGGARPLPTPPRPGANNKSLEEVIRDGPRTPRSPRPLAVEREEKKEEPKPNNGEATTPPPVPKKPEKPKMPQPKAKDILYETLCEYHKQKKFRNFIRKSPELKNGRLRNQYIQEIITTERTYVGTLDAIVEVFVKQLKGKKKTLDPEKQNVIFSNIEQIYQVNRELLGDLEAANNQWPIQCNIGQVFCRMAPFLKTYTTYINNYDEADSMLEKQLSKSNRFSSWVEKQQQHPKVNHLTLQGLLITPIQRIPRYKLLLNDLLKRTPEEHRDYDSLTKALSSIKEIAQFVNESKRKNENTQIMMDLQQKLKDKLPNLIQPARKFVKEVNNIYVTCSALKLATTNMNAYLFSDLLLLLPAESSSSSSGNTHQSQHNPIVLHHVLAKFVSSKDNPDEDDDDRLRVESLQPSGRTVFEFRGDNLRSELVEDYTEWMDRCRHVQEKRNTDISLKKAESIRMKLGHKVPKLKNELSTLHIDVKTMKRRLVEVNKDLEKKMKERKTLERQIGMNQQELSKTKVELKELIKKETNLSSEVAEEADDVKEADEVLWTALNGDPDAFQYLFGMEPTNPIDKESQQEKQPSKTGDGPTTGRGFRLNNLIRVNLNESDDKEEDKEAEDLLAQEKEERNTDRDADAILATDDNLLSWEDFINDDSPEMVQLNRLHHVNLNFPMEQDTLVYKYAEDREKHGTEPQVKSKIEAIPQAEVNYKYQEPLSAKMCEETVAGEEGSKPGGVSDKAASGNDVDVLKKQLEKIQEERDMWKKKFTELRMQM